MDVMSTPCSVLLACVTAGFMEVKDTFSVWKIFESLVRIGSTSAIKKHTKQFYTFVEFRLSQQL